MPKAIRSDAGPHRRIGGASVALLSGLVVVAAVAIFACVRAGAQAKPPAQPLDLNTATLEQLERLPGIRKEIAESIVKFREKGGPFQRVEHLRAIRGISKARFEKIRLYVTVIPPAHTSG
jgi:competence ComEA-like helix-hairpin-helix protein